VKSTKLKTMLSLAIGVLLSFLANYYFNKTRFHYEQAFK